MPYRDDRLFRPSSIDFANESIIVRMSLLSTKTSLAGFWVFRSEATEHQPSHVEKQRMKLTLDPGVLRAARSAFRFRTLAFIDG
mgnify:CR=1 FL=1